MKEAIMKPSSEVLFDGGVEGGGLTLIRLAFPDGGVRFTIDSVIKKYFS